VRDVSRWYAQVSPYEKPFVAFRLGECSLEEMSLEIANAAAHAISFGLNGRRKCATSLAKRTDE